MFAKTSQDMFKGNWATFAVTDMFFSGLVPKMIIIRRPIIDNWNQSTFTGKIKFQSMSRITNDGM